MTAPLCLDSTWCEASVASHAYVREYTISNVPIEAIIACEAAIASHRRDWNETARPDDAPCEAGEASRALMTDSICAALPIAVTMGCEAAIPSHRGAWADIVPPDGARIANLKRCLMFYATTSIFSVLEIALQSTTASADRSKRQGHQKVPEIVVMPSMASHPQQERTKNSRR